MGEILYRLSTVKVLEKLISKRMMIQHNDPAIIKPIMIHR
ncbi:hypothetical protein F320042A7_18590 [Blautia producta]